MEISEEGDLFFPEDQGNVAGFEDEIHEEAIDTGDHDADDLLEGQDADADADAGSVGDAEVEGEVGFDESYEIRDEEDGTTDAARESGGGENKSEEKKDENMLVVDEWDNEDVESLSESEEADATEEKLLDPEDVERGLLHMPTMQTVMGDLLHLRRNRRLSVHPLTIAELSNPTLQAILNSDKCEEAKMQFVRPAADLRSWTGFLSLTFISSKAATKAIDELKAFKEGLTVKAESNPDQAIERFIKEERKSAAWPTIWADKLLLVRGITADTKADELKPLFAAAEEVAVIRDSSSSSAPRRRSSSATTAEDTKTPGYAYVLFENASDAKLAADTYAVKPPEFKDQLLDIKMYREPTDVIPRSLLWLRRRKLVLKQLDRMMRNLEKSRKDPTVKIAPWTEKRIATCKTLIEKDDKVRADLNLPTPSLEDFKQIRGLRPYKGDEAERILVVLGVVDRRKKAPATQQQGTAANKDGGEKAGNNAPGLGARKRYQDRRKLRGAMGGPRRGPRSPPPRRRDWSPVRGGRFGGRRGNPLDAAALGLMNPLALTLMQQNMGLVGGVNPSLLNQMMLNPALAATMMGGNAGGPGPMPFLGPPPSGRDMEGPSKMLRLDESGSFRPRGDYRGGDRGFDRDDRRRDHGRHRSRSPEFQRGPGRSGGMGPRGFDGPRDSGRGYGDGGAGPGSRPIQEDDINVLMNLSKMLSQKMEQKRQQVEHGGYDRM